MKDTTTDIIEALDIVSEAHEDALDATDRASELLARVCRDYNHDRISVATVKAAADAVLIADHDARVIRAEALDS